MKTKKLLSILSVLVLLFAALPALSVGAGGEKVDVCHNEGNGTFHLINISDNAFPAHVEHGDASPGEMVPGMEGKKFDEACNVVDAGPTVTPGYSGLTEAAGVRYRGNSSGNEIYLGKADLGVGGNRVEASYPNVYANWTAGSYAVTFVYDQGAGKISTSINGAGGTAYLEYPLGTLACPASAWNTMDINVVDRLSGGNNLRFNNVTLNGIPLGNFGEEGWKNWTVSDFDFSQSFIIEGDLVVEGVWSGSETNKLQIVVGCLP